MAINFGGLRSISTQKNFLLENLFSQLELFSIRKKIKVENFHFFFCFFRKIFRSMENFPEWKWAFNLANTRKID